MPDPYFNEPGYASSAHTAHGAKHSAAYNAKLRPATVQHSILAPLLKPDAPPHAPFKALLALHFKAKAEEIAATMREWRIAAELQAQVQGAIAKLG